MGGGRGSEPFRSWCTTNTKPFSLFRYGTLTGKRKSRSDSKSRRKR